MRSNRFWYKRRQGRTTITTATTNTTDAGTNDCIGAGVDCARRRWKTRARPSPMTKAITTRVMPHELCVEEFEGCSGLIVAASAAVTYVMTAPQRSEYHQMEPMSAREPKAATSVAISLAS